MKCRGSNRAARHRSPQKMMQPRGENHDNPFRKAGRFAILALAALTIMAAPSGSLHAQARTARAKTDDATAPKIDPVMELAFSKARASLDQFLELARIPPAHLRGFALKVSIAEEPDIVEYFWINDFTQNGDSFSGKINNRPLLVKRVRSGRTHQFQRTDIVDWTYIDTETRTVHGNFTACALLARKPADLAAELREKFGLICNI